MSDILNILYKLKIFTLQELTQALDGKVTSVASLLTRYKQKGWIIQIRRNTFCMIDFASGLPTCNKFEIGSHLSKTACISYHSALEFHGFAHQPFNEVFVKSVSRFNSFLFDSVNYTYCRQTVENIGMISPLGNPYIKVTDLESTLIDCIDRIDRAGGVEELLHCMEGIYLLNEEKIKYYLSIYNKSFLYQKTGFLLEQIKEQANISDNLIDFCRKKSGSHVKWLVNSEESDAFVNKWRMYVPKNLTYIFHTHPKMFQYEKFCSPNRLK